MDDKLKKSIQTKFFLGQGRDEEQVITKKSLTSLSLGFTAVQNAFNQVKTYTSNVGKIQAAVIAARVAGKKEAAVERSNVAPIQQPQDQITNLFPQLTKGLEELQKSLQGLELNGNPSAEAISQAENKVLGFAGKVLLGGGGVAGLAYAAFSSDEAEAAPPPEPDATPPAPKASEVAKEADQKVQERQVRNEQSGSRKAQKQVAQEQQTERLTKTAELAAAKPTPVTRTAAPQAANSWTDNLSDYINKSVETANARAAAIAAGGGAMMASGDDGTGGAALTSGSYDMKLAGLLASYEGVRTTAYKDSRGIPTIGIGATYYPPGFRLQGKVQMGQTITEEEARQIKAAHVEEHRGRLLREVSSSDYNAMPDNVKAALESKVFNYGNVGGTLAQLTRDAVRTKNYRPVSNFFRTTLAAHNGGLNASRRNDEATLIDTGRSPRSGITFGGASTSFGTGNAAGPIQRSGQAVQGMGYETAQAATRQMGIRGTNGNLDSGQLEAIGVGNLKAAPPAARAIKALRAAAAREGINIGVTDAYRDYATQVRLKQQKGRMAATPGRSNHGWGLAFDLSDAGRGLQQNSRAYQWLKANSERFGIFGPLANPYEIWHWEFRGGGSLRPATVPVSPAQQLGAPRLRTPAGALMSDYAATNPRGECSCDEPTYIPVPVGGGAPSPTDYLKGMKPAQVARKYNVNTSEDYKVYFNAA